MLCVFNLYANADTQLRAGAATGAADIHQPPSAMMFLFFFPLRVHDGGAPLPPAPEVLIPRNRVQTARGQRKEHSEHLMLVLDSGPVSIVFLVLPVVLLLALVLVLVLVLDLVPVFVQVLVSVLVLTLVLFLVLVLVLLLLLS